MVDYYFFLSYARGDDQHWVNQFFDNLSAEVRSHAGLPANRAVGFLDMEMPVGERWSQALMTALDTCRTFVALISPRYLISEACGREWAVFDDRLRTLEDRGPLAHPPPLLPLLWLPPTQLPHTVVARQYLNHGMPDVYDRGGLRQMMRLTRHRDDYLELLDRLARQIVACAHSGQPMPGSRAVTSFHQVRSAFLDDPRPPAVTSPASRVEFVVAAPALADLAWQLLPGVTRDPRFYGNEPRHWAPFRPTVDAPIADRAQAVALEHQFHSVITDLDTVHTRIDENGTGERIVILLIDLWITGVLRHRSLLAQFDTDSTTPSFAPVLVTANDGDEQTHTHLDRLLATLSEVFFQRMHARSDVTFRSVILSPQSFDADLGVVLERSRNRVLRTGSARRSTTTNHGERPILRGP
uniref:TIR-like protein FxsC n=1 Tax=Paractinoplanes polyasparticus TaxID=2856853 RepID=UPI001C847DB8|nr:TIR-like protein FxsC [Actinoplanes polyasparticus]